MKGKRKMKKESHFRLLPFTFFLLPYSPLLLVSRSCVIMQVMTVLPSLQGLGLKIEGPETRHYPNCLMFSAGASSRLDHFEEMKVMHQLSERRPPLV
jgi:hypothetical protein